jgi:hypothetical protein
MRTAQSERVKFFQHARLTNERVVVRDVIISGDAVLGRAGNRMAYGTTAHIDIDAKNPGEQFLVNNLSGRAFIIAVGPVQETIERVKKETTAVMPEAIASLVNQDKFRAGESDAVCVQGKAGKPIVIFAGHVFSRECRGPASDRPWVNPCVIHVEVTVGGEAGMESEVQQTGIIPALALAANIEHERFGIGGRMVGEGPDATFALPNHELGCAGDIGETDGVGESQVGERNDR